MRVLECSCGEKIEVPSVLKMCSACIIIELSEQVSPVLYDFEVEGLEYCSQPVDIDDEDLPF